MYFSNDDIGLVTIATKDYFRGAIALIHSFRRWYPDLPVYIFIDDLVIAESDYDFKLFRKAHGDVEICSLDDLRERYGLSNRLEPHYLKPFAILEADLDKFLFFDSDIIVAFKLGYIFDLINSGFLWSCNSTSTFGELIQVPELLSKSIFDLPMYTSGIFGGSKSNKAEKMLRTWIDNTLDDKIRQTHFLDMPLMNLSILQNDLLQFFARTSDDSLYGTLFKDSVNTVFKNGLLFSRKKRSQGPIPIVHYNGEKPWNAYDNGGWSESWPGRLENEASLDLWSSVYDSFQNGDECWLPSIT